jgi:hypothetical protein
MKSKFLTLLCGLSLLLPIVFWSLLRDLPSPLYPLPLLVVAFALVFRYAAIAVPMLLFFAWNPGLFRGEAMMPKRSYVLLAVLTLLSVPWFGVGWKFGLAYQGGRYCYSVLMTNICWLAGLWLVFARTKRADSFAANLFFHWMLFAWLAWYAFPYLGELP